MLVCGAPCRQHLWRRLLDTMADEAMCLKHLLSMPESDTWINKKKPPISDSGEAHTQTFIQTWIGEHNEHVLLTTIL